MIVLTAIINRAKQARKKNPKSTCAFIFQYKKNQKDLSPISIKSKELPLSMGLIDFKEDKISFSNVDKVNGLIQIILEINQEKQSFNDESNKTYFTVQLKDMKSDNEPEVLNWSITNDTELSVKFQMKGKFTQEEDCIIRKRASDMTINTKNKFQPSLANSKPIVEIKSFNIRDRLNIFDKKKNDTNTLNKNRIAFTKQAPIKKEPIIVEKKEKDDSSRNNSIASATTTVSVSAKPSVQSSINVVGSNETFLEGISNYEYTKKCKDSGLNIDSKGQLQRRDCFCEGFFLASFPFKGAKVIEKSQSYPSICNHKQCSMLPAMQPEIIYRYPLKDTKTLELNNLAATICFPTGIKVCYEEKAPDTVKNYSTPITNQQGDRYYMMTFHFYFKLLNSEYNKLYEMHPLKHHLMKFADSYLDSVIDKKATKIIQTNLELCQELGFKDIVYVPYCLCLISKFPYIKQMEVCLQSLYSLLSGFNPKENNNIYEVIMFLINSIPIPSINTRIKFYLPFCPHSIEINCPKYKDMSILNYNLSNLLILFSVENIITIFRLMLFEKKILFVDNEYNRLSEVTDCFISLLYPFQWIHTYIPIMSDQMIKYLETFLPFLNGINESLMPYVKETLIENEDEVYIIYIDKNKIDINYSLRGHKVKIKKIIDETTPELPLHLVKKLTRDLNSIKSKVDDNNSTSSFSNRDSTSTNSSTLENIKSILDIKIRNAFLNIIVEMFHDYNKYLCVLDDDVVFNTSALIENRPAQDSHFYKEYTETQLFQQFTQNVLKEDYNYFNSMIEAFESKNIEEDKIIDSSFKNECTYVIRPQFIQSKETDISAFEKELVDNYSISSLMGYDNGIIKENKRIVGRINTLTESGFNEDKSKMYYLPGYFDANKNSTKKKDNRSTLIAGKAEIFESRERYNNSQKQRVATKLRYREFELTEKEKEAIKETIKDAVMRIFTSVDLKSTKDKDRKDVLQSMSNSFGRDFFIKLLYKNNTNIKILQKEAFDLLFSIIYNELLNILKLEENDKTLEDTVLLLKSCCFYGINNKKLLWNELCPKLKNYALVVKKSLWSKWIEIDIKEKNAEGKTLLIIELIKEMMNKMLQLSLEKDFIKKTIDSISESKISNVNELDKFKNKIVEIISNYKYN